MSYFLVIKIYQIKYEFSNNFPICESIITWRISNFCFHTDILCIIKNLKLIVQKKIKK
jgi:hypothetical protein